ncbi:MAG: protein kinase domain-containing protein, partial [Acidobacteriaceae bacterium]
MRAQSIDEKAIFKVACCIASTEARNDYLNQVCGGDHQEVRDRVAFLLRMQEESPSFMESPIAGGDATLDMGPALEIPGTQIGPYKLLEQIGEGGMGVVYMASQKQPVRRTVALKIIKLGMDTREVVSRFEAERQALAMMDHPNIAKVFDGGTTDAGRPYFVMELIKRGKPITEYCDREQFSTRARLELFVTLCHAVQHAHQKGVIHRDLKPSNVLVEVHDVRPVPKIIDFGVAKAVGPQLTDKSLHTGLDQIVGTPLYMSPEQAGQSSVDVDTRSDVYSLGVLLYELLTGHTPFERDTLRAAGVDELRRIIREVEPPRPSARVSTLEAALLSTISERRHVEPHKLSQQLRGELDWIVMKALDKDRDRRYESANDFARDIQRYLHDEPVEACPPSTVYRLRKYTRRHQAAVIATTAVSLALLLGAGVAAGQAYRATKAEQVAQEQLQIAQEQKRLARRQAQLAKAQEQIAEEERQLALEMLALATGGIDAAAWSTGPDGSVLVFCRTGQVLRCDPQTGVMIDEFANFARQEPVSRYQRLVVGHDLTGDGRAELYATGYETVRILDGASGKTVQVFTRGAGSVTSEFLGRDEIRVGPDGLLYDLWRGEVRRYDGRTLQFIDTFVTSASAASGGDTGIDSGTFAFGPDGHLYAAIWGLQNVVRYDGQTGRELNEFVPKDVQRLRDPRGMAFGADGNLHVVTAQSLLIYDGANGRLLREIPAEVGQQFWGLFVQPAGTLCVAASDQLLRFDPAVGRLEPFLRYYELVMHYLARRVGDEPGLRSALQGSELLNTLAWSLVWQRGTGIRDAELGIQLATAAVGDARNNGPIWHTLGAAYYRAGRWEEARDALCTSDRLCGPTAYVSFFLSMTYARLGNLAQARTEYERGSQLLAGWEHQVVADGAKR